MTAETYEKYLQRLKTEYSLYKMKISNQDVSWYITHAQELLDMKNAYEYLTSRDISPNELEYVMQAKYPIHIVAQTREAFEAVKNADNPMALTVYDLCEKKLLNRAVFEKYMDSATIVFQRKPSTLDELRMYSSRTDSDQYKVEKIIELTPEGFEHFTESLISDYPFIADNKNHMWVKDGVYHCLLITTAERKEGLLVESDGYDYARYCADVPNVSELIIGDVPVEKYGRQRGRNRTFEPPAR